MNQTKYLKTTEKTNKIDRILYSIFTKLKINNILKRNITSLTVLLFIIYKLIKYQLNINESVWNYMHRYFQYLKTWLHNYHDKLQK